MSVGKGSHGKEWEEERRGEGGEGRRRERGEGRRGEGRGEMCNLIVNDSSHTSHTSHLTLYTPHTDGWSGIGL